MNRYKAKKILHKGATIHVNRQQCYDYKDKPLDFYRQPFIVTSFCNNRRKFNSCISFTTLYEIPLMVRARSTIPSPIKKKLRYYEFELSEITSINGMKVSLEQEYI